MTKRTFIKGQAIEVQPEPGEPWVGATYTRAEPDMYGWHRVRLNKARKVEIAGETRMMTMKLIATQRIRESEEPFNPRAQWTPKIKPLEEQCATCPFNDQSDFDVIVQKLCEKAGELNIKGYTTKQARLRILRETAMHGDFACHHTAYDSEMNLKPACEHRQCPGASKHFILAGVELAKKRGA